MDLGRVEEPVAIESLAPARAPGERALERDDRRLVVRVAYERVGGGTHEHVAGLWTLGDYYNTPDEVSRSLGRGEDWWSDAGGRRMPIWLGGHCPWPGCDIQPYLHVAATDRGGRP
jgi:hypothetical protein